MNYSKKRNSFLYLFNTRKMNMIRVNKMNHSAYLPKLKKKILQSRKKYQVTNLATENTYFQYRKLRESNLYVISINKIWYAPNKFRRINTKLYFIDEKYITTSINALVKTNTYSIVTIKLYTNNIWLHSNGSSHTLNVLWTTCFLSVDCRPINTRLSQHQR